MSSSTKNKFIDLAEGKEVSFIVAITESMVDDFARLSGDFNPLHTDENYAGSTEFKQRLAHGAIGEALFSRLVGMYLPGQYSLYLKQTTEFRKPVYLNSTVIVKGKIIKLVPSLKLVELETVLLNATNNEVLISGIALVKVLQ